MFLRKKSQPGTKSLLTFGFVLPSCTVGYLPEYSPNTIRYQANPNTNIRSQYITEQYPKPLSGLNTFTPVWLLQFAVI